MNTILQRLGVVIGWVWKRTAAAVAVVLIVAAFIVGNRIDGLAPEPATETTTGAHDHAEHDHAEGADQEQVYTCSMHPSVQLDDPDGQCPICGMDLIPVNDGGGGGEGNARRISISKSAAARSRVETAPVARFLPTAEVRLYGKVTYDETSVARLTAYFPGRIERLFVNYAGVPVAEGEHMAEIYSPELLAAFEELRQAADASEHSSGMTGIVGSATRDMLVAAREKLRLYGLTEAQIDAVESGEHDADRLTVFAPIGGVVTHLAVREGDYVKEGSPIATVADLSRLWLDFEAYESQLPLLRWGQRVTFTVEALPGEEFEGRVSFIEPTVDETTRTAAVRIALDNSDRRLKPGMFASAVVRPRVGEGGAVVSDELAGRWIGPMHPTIVKDGPGQCDICGMDLVPAESLGVVGDPSSAEEPLVIPRSAVLFTGTRSVVYVEVPETERPTYEGREVVLGARAGDFYIVRKGLTRGERVVVNGAFRIDSAMQIAAKPSMMMPDDDGGDGPEPVDVPDTFIHSLKPVYAAYFDAQEALASDNFERFKRAAGDLNTALDLVERAGLVGEPLSAWRRAAAGLRVDDALTSIEAARGHFEGMSEAVISLQERFGHRDSETWHVAHCPMAFDFEGADWLQRGDQVNNPYFGASMLRCGDIQQSFDPVDGDEKDEAPMNGAMEGHDHE